jgi:hypothetical protein
MSEHEAGRQLLNKWKAVAAKVDVQFIAVDGAFELKMCGTVSPMPGTDELVQILGSGCELTIDYSDAGFKYVATDAGLEQAGLSAEAYSEGVTISLAPIGNCLIQAVPKLRPASQSN